MNIENVDDGTELQDIQQKLKAPKGQFNNFGKYSYRNCEDILEAVKPLLGGAKLTLSDSIEAVCGRVYVKATATFTSSTGSVTTTTAFAREPESKKGMDASQITGAASSYARKYALNGLFLIDDNKDADSQDNRKPPEPNRSGFGQPDDNELFESLSLSLEGAVNDNLIDSAKASETLKKAQSHHGKDLTAYVKQVNDKLNGLRG